MDGIGSRFDILVTHVEKFHGLVKLFGQIDLERGQLFKKKLFMDIFQRGGGINLLFHCFQIHLFITLLFLSLKLGFQSLF